MSSSQKFLTAWHEMADLAAMKKSYPGAGQLGRPGALYEVQELLDTIDSLTKAPDLAAQAPKTRRPALERDMQLSARRARSLGRSVLSKGLNTVRRERASGLLDKRFDLWKKSVGAAGKVSVKEIWSDAMNMKGVRETLEARGFARSLQNRIDALLDEYDQIHFLDAQGRLSSTLKSSGTTVTYKDPGPPNRDTSLHGLLSKGRFDAISSRFERPGQVAADAVLRTHKSGTDSIAGREHDLADGVLLSSVLSMRELNRQAGELDEIGIPAVEGNLAGWLIAVIVLAAVGIALAIVGGILVSVCFETGEDAYCTAAGILVFLGMLCMCAVLFIGGAVEFGTTVALSAVLFGLGIAGVIYDIEILTIWFGGEGGELTPSDE